MLAVGTWCLTLCFEADLQKQRGVNGSVKPGFSARK